ncbi:MAG: hypothetical protein KBS81_00495 [Spirochaetales bacterium]|nr:hypothetical protein [Candidatus Physcosoma equi]
MARTIEKIQIFDAFRATMLDYFFRYGEKLERGRKATVSHRIAMLMQKHVPLDAEIDIDIDGTDILLTRDGIEELAIFWSSTYMTEREKEKAQKYHTEKSPHLTLAFSLLEDKDYLLVYRFEEDYLEYLHINRKDFSEKLLKRCMIKDQTRGQEQLLLDIKTKRKRKKKATSSAEEDSNNSDENLGNDGSNPDTVQAE